MEWKKRARAAVPIPRPPLSTLSLLPFTRMPHPALARDNVAVITGAAYGGIGSATALLLATRFHLQLILADISVEGLQRSSDELVKAGVPEEQFTTRVTDVSDPKDVQDLADYVYESKGRCDFLFLNAGVQVPSKSFGGDLEDWDQTFKVNFGGVLNGTQAFVERMVEQVRKKKKLSPPSPSPPSSLPLPMGPNASIYARNRPLQPPSSLPDQSRESRILLGTRRTMPLKLFVSASAPLFYLYFV